MPKRSWFKLRISSRHPHRNSWALAHPIAVHLRPATYRLSNFGFVLDRDSRFFRSKMLSAND